VKDLRNMEDFLYATTDVAIWSTSETGIGIAASCFATLRPLFRTFFGRSKFMGGTSSQGGSSPWPAPNGPRHGYIRSGRNARPENFALRSDIKKDTGITTTIGSDGDLERLEKGSRSKRTSIGPSIPPRGWNDNEDRLTEVSSEDEERLWGNGIKKTTVLSQ
jgi:hypothetical protein